jgi:putative PEP-CTERM system histidine kinase
VIQALHGGCAILYAGLAALILLRQRPSRTGLWLAGACGITALWAAGAALGDGIPSGGLPFWLELARSAAWYGFILHLFQRGAVMRRQLRQVFATIGLLALLLVGGLPLASVLSAQPPEILRSISAAARLGFAVCGILLLENLYLNTEPDARWHINLLCIALGGLFLYDLFLYADAILFRHVSPPLFAARAAVTASAAPLIALAAARNRRWAINIHVSRTIVFHSASLLISGVFLLGLALAGEIFRRGGAEWGNVAEVTLICGGVLGLAVLATSGSARSNLRALLVDNFFSARYDYRREWMRCIETLTAPEAHTGLHIRAVRAVAQVVDSPAGCLFLRGPDEVAFHWAGSWNMPAAAAPVPPGHALVALLGSGEQALELSENSQAGAWFPELPRLWLAVPLCHTGALIGFVLLVFPRAQFTLDREVFGLLRVIGREVASRIAEQRAEQILSQTQQLREYSQRFAFVLHDIKNVSGQLSMLLTNAEIHAGNPEFQRDMLSTVRASVDKISRLLNRLQPERQERSHAVITPGERLKRITESVRTARGGQIILTVDDTAAGVAIEPEAFDAAVTHLLNNAVEACGPGSPVNVTLRQEPLRIVLDITDRGPGMPPEFVRDELFRPFATTKGGHGIGAFQARELLRQAGGDLLVISHPGEGTTMRIMLPALRAATALAAE